jgi:hypothetical protein
MKKAYWILIVVLLVIGFFMVFRPGGEDSWIKDEKGEYVEHGFPSETPDYVKEQQIAIIQAKELYFQKKQEGIEFSSQCLGTVGEEIRYVVDIVHVPRNEEDDKLENQCEDYREGKVEHFIELDQEGNIFRIV